MPILQPTLAALPVDLIQFGIKLEIAQLTRPVGMNLFVLCRVAKESFPDNARGAFPCTCGDRPRKQQNKTSHVRL